MSSMPDGLKDVSNLQKLWSEEYRRGGIPSSVRLEPSGVLLAFLDFLKGHAVSPGRILDLGCGGGRNSLWLARQGWYVTAIDFTQEAIDRLHANARTESLESRIEAHCQDLAAAWPAKSGSIDAAFDAFCYKHLIEEERRRAYEHSLAKAVRPGGWFSISFAGLEDGYYRQFPVATASLFANELHIHDPGNGIDSLLYSPEALAARFAKDWKLITCATKAKSYVMHGTTYVRQTHHCIFQRLDSALSDW